MNISRISLADHKKIIQRHVEKTAANPLVSTALAAGRQILNKLRGGKANYFANGNWKDTGLNLGRNLIVGNEFEGAMLGARMFGGADPGFGTYLGGGLAFDLLRPSVARGIKSLDSKLLSRYGTGGRYQRVRDAAASGYDKFRAASKWAPAADIAGMVQQENVGFNQFDPAASIAIGQERALNSVANSLGWDNREAMTADMQQYQPILRAGKKVLGGLSSGVNAVTQPFNRRALNQLPDEQLTDLVNQALGSYGDSFLSKAPRDQAAIVRNLYRTTALSGGAY